MQRILFACREVHVYRVPQQQLVQKRFLCQEWEGEHVFTGRCRVVEESTRVWIRLEDRVSGELFAESPLDESEPQHAVDSSRYFVLLVKDRDTQRKAWLGIGFEQRGEAFDFVAALNDAKRQNQPTTQGDQPKPVSKDFSLKQGQKLKLSIPGMKKAQSTARQGSNDNGIESLLQDSQVTTTHKEHHVEEDTSAVFPTTNKAQSSQPCLDDLLF
jgi:hypothetical protein